MASSSKPTELEFIRSKRDKPMLIRGGYKYHLNMTYDNGKSIWRCAKRGQCNASVTLCEKRENILSDKKHSCLPDFVRNKIDKVLDTCKIKVQETFEPIQQIFEEQLENLKVQCKSVLIPTYKSKKDSLRRSRLKAWNVPGTLFSSLEDVVIPNILSSDFLIAEEGGSDKILIFATKLGKNYIKKSKKVFGDGLFKVPKPFKQLYTLHIDLNSTDECTNLIPIVYAFLPNKCQQTYHRLFHILKNKFGLQVEQYRCDYELATINAVEEIFPDAQVIGCYFHFQYAIWRNSSKQNFADSKEGKKITRLTAHIALLPASAIPEAWLSIQEFGENVVGMNDFVEYFDREWINIITINRFCCSSERHRTKNMVESWHKRLQSKVNRKSTLFKFINQLRKEGIHYNYEIRKSEVYYDVKKRSRTSVLYDESLNRLIKDYCDEKIGVIKCLKKIVTLRWIQYNKYDQ